jgi:DNA-binding response OmpR family regulator
VEVAGDGDTGLALAATGVYDVLMVDQQMPGKGGLEVLRTLATWGALPPTIMVTGHGDEAIAVEAMKLGAGDYVVKDVDGRHLTLLPTVVARVVHQQRLLEEKRQAEEVLQQTLAALETRVRERTAALQQANAHLHAEIAERRRAEVALAQLNRRHKLILDSAGEGIYGIDLEGRTTFVNPAAARLLGWEGEELIGQPYKTSCATRCATDTVFLRRVPDPRRVSGWRGPACPRGRVLAQRRYTSWSNTSARRFMSMTPWWVRWSSSKILPSARGLNRRCRVPSG